MQHFSPMYFRVFFWLLASCVFSQAEPQTPKQQYKTKEQCDQQATRAFDNGLEVNALLVSEGRRIPVKILVEDMDNESGVELAFAEVLNQLFPGSFDVTDDAMTVLYASATDLRKSAMGVQTYHVPLFTRYMARVRS